jgi:hypothetical protein
LDQIGPTRGARSSPHADPDQTSTIRLLLAEPLRSTLPHQFHNQDLAMSLSQESKYPSRRTYVLKLRSDAKPDALAGRLENIVTGRQHAFESAHELLVSLTSELASASGDPPQGEP